MRERKNMCMCMRRVRMSVTRVYMCKGPVCVEDVCVLVCWCLARAREPGFEQSASRAEL